MDADKVDEETDGQAGGEPSLQSVGSLGHHGVVGTQDEVEEVDPLQVEEGEVDGPSQDETERDEDEILPREPCAAGHAGRGFTEGQDPQPASLRTNESLVRPTTGGITLSTRVVNLRS